MADLIALRFAARFINVTAGGRTLAHLAGSKRSNQRGRGVEFDEVRQYAAGDDVRSIDWRVTARSGTAHTKLFHEERERPVLVAVDQRQTMKFGSRTCFKSVQAAHAASLLLWSGLDRGERVGGMVFDDHHFDDVRPRRSRNSVLAMIGHLHAYGQPSSVGTGGQDLADHIRQLSRIARPGSHTFIISDFDATEGDSLLEGLRHLVRRTQVTAIRIGDPLEQELPVAGRYVVTDGNTKTALNTADAQLRRRFSEDARDRHQQLVSSLQGLRIPLLELSTIDPTLPALQRVFPDR
ncbi:ATPase [Luminiphilus syltensis NOR5-1B]|uniref:ATPase n=1 Tax=Luminiphilus syltensis NOR5-1B TaxID=565045 RepID=B8KXX0_9GAMM|nr:ATPase [Luminiphilus syltensis NOR5-1B]